MFFWCRRDSEKITHKILLHWGNQKLVRSMRSRETTSMYYQIRAGKSILNDFRGKYTGNFTCCLCGLEDESIEHLLLHCTGLRGQRNVLRKGCLMWGVEVSVETLMSDIRFKDKIENIIQIIINNKRKLGKLPKILTNDVK